MPPVTAKTVKYDDTVTAVACRPAQTHLDPVVDGAPARQRRVEVEDLGFDPTGAAHAFARQTGHRRVRVGTDERHQVAVDLRDIERADTKRNTEDSLVDDLHLHEAPILDPVLVAPGHLDELFLGHFKYEARNKRKESTITADSVLGSFGERIEGLTEEEAQLEANRCMSCGMCFECDSCVIFCPQDAIFRVKKTDSTMGRYVDTDYTKCIGCHICEDVCPSGYIKMGMGE